MDTNEYIVAFELFEKFAAIKKHNIVRKSQ